MKDAESNPRHAAHGSGEKPLGCNTKGRPSLGLGSGERDPAHPEEPGTRAGCPWCSRVGIAPAPSGRLVPGPGGQVEREGRARHMQQGMPELQLSETVNRVLFRLM